MTDFFQDWVFTGGFVHYSIDSTQIVENGGNYDVTVYMKQKLRGRETFANSNRVEVTFMNDDFTTNTQMMEFDGEFGAQTFTVPFSPMLTMCDYNERTSDATIDETKFHTTIGLKTYSYLYFKANVVNIVAEDTAMLRITHNWAAPDTFNVAVPGLYIANHRFWTVEGNFPSTFKSKGEFQYSTATTSAITGYLDNEFITNSLDSIVLLYRPDRATEWSIEPCINQTTMKKLTVDSLKNGEYSLGIYDWDAYTKTQQNIVVNNASVYPNPNNGDFYVSTGEKFIGEIKVTDITGKEVYKSEEKNESDYMLIKLGDLPNGLYVVSGQNRFNGKTFNKKFIVQK
jgi:hypothetical protein